MPQDDKGELLVERVRRLAAEPTKEAYEAALWDQARYQYWRMHGVECVLHGMKRVLFGAELDDVTDKLVPIARVATPSADLARQGCKTCQGKAEICEKIGKAFDEPCRFAPSSEQRPEPWKTLNDALVAYRALEAQLKEVQRDSNYRYQKYQEEFQRAEDWMGRYNAMAALVDQQQERAQKAESALSAITPSMKPCQEALSTAKSVINFYEDGTLIATKRDVVLLALEVVRLTEGTGP
jgi:hypothetical protein